MWSFLLGVRVCSNIKMRKELLSYPCCQYCGIEKPGRFAPAQQETWRGRRCGYCGKRASFDNWSEGLDSLSRRVDAELKQAAQHWKNLSKYYNWRISECVRPYGPGKGQGTGRGKTVSDLGLMSQLLRTHSRVIQEPSMAQCGFNLEDAIWFAGGPPSRSWRPCPA